jgi:hypothetical protein
MARRIVRALSGGGRPSSSRRTPARIDPRAHDRPDHVPEAAPGPPAPAAAGPGELAALEAEARYARERHALYRAKAYAKEVNTARMRELERLSQYADSRLRAARRRGT